MKINPCPVILAAALITSLSGAALGANVGISEGIRGNVDVVADNSPATPPYERAREAVYRNFQKNNVTIDSATVQSWPGIDNFAQEGISLDNTF